MFDPSGGDGMGKIFVHVDFADFNQRMITNSVRSVGVVPKRNLQDNYVDGIIQGGLTSCSRNLSATGMNPQVPGDSNSVPMGG